MLIILYKNSYKIHEHLPVKLYKVLFVIKIVSICMMDEPGGFIHMIHLRKWKRGLERHKGEKWLVKNEIRIWSGRVWHCQHNKRKESCTTCGGSSICEHGRQRSKCKECGGASICEHGRQRSRCKECGGGSICEHGKRKNICATCGGGSICEHGRQRPQCIQCEGSKICRICKSKTGNRKYDKLCVTCAINEGHIVKRNYKTKELSMVEFITEHTKVDWTNDKAYDLGCSKEKTRYGL